MKRVIVESPYAGNILENVTYARRCLRDCILRGETPYASHLLYTQDGVLDDSVPNERKLGIDAGFHWREVAEKTVVYCDYGITDGMENGISHSQELDIPVEYRTIGRNMDLDA